MLAWIENVMNDTEPFISLGSVRIYFTWHIQASQHINWLIYKLPVDAVLDNIINIAEYFLSYFSTAEGDGFP